MPQPAGRSDLVAIGLDATERLEPGTLFPVYGEARLVDDVDMLASAYGSCGVFPLFKCDELRGMLASGENLGPGSKLAIGLYPDSACLVHFAAWTERKGEGNCIITVPGPNPEAVAKDAASAWQEYLQQRECISVSVTQPIQVGEALVIDSIHVLHHAREWS